MDINLDIVKNHPMFISATVFSAIAIWMLPTPLGDQMIFGIVLAVASGFAGKILGRDYRRIVRPLFRITLLGATLIVIALALVAYMLMLKRIPSPTLLQLLGEVVLYMLVFVGVFTLAESSDASSAKER